ncbi:MAG: sporulation-delaying protein SdpB family protein, partial [Bacteroidota bacterium]
MFRSIDRFGRKLNVSATRFNWTNTYGFARTILAIGTLITIGLNDINMLIAPLGEPMDKGIDVYLMNFSIFSIFSENLVLAKCLSIVLLLIVASGWRPRVTGLVHFWISFSVAGSFSVIDGGDQITQILTLLILPICLIDNRKWHWEYKAERNISPLRKHMTLIVITCLFLIRIQAAFVYYHAGIGKMFVEEWMNGTALYYWLNVPLFQISGFLSWLISPLLYNPFTVTIGTWGVMIFEVLLFLGIFMDKKWYPSLLKAGILFHFLIIVFFGLGS